MAELQGVIYWDTSAVLSLLFTDCHSSEAGGWAEKQALHLLSTLAVAEASAVMARMEREKAVTAADTSRAHDFLINGIWRRVIAAPEWKDLQPLAAKYPLRGADLWHLALTVRLKRELPELRLLTFDQQLRSSAKGEDMEMP